MKLIIQIPCLNEALSLPKTIRDIPKSIQGIDEIKILVIDDGSIDSTSQVAINEGVDYITRSSYNRGLAASFNLGIETSLSLGADIIVTTDGDNQYPGKYIQRLVQPILKNNADIVIGVRDFKRIKEFSKLKVFFQRFGSKCISYISGIKIDDATSGFRAFSRSAAMRQIVLSKFTYTLETIIQSGKMGWNIESVPITTNPPLRKSRLFKSNSQYIFKSFWDIILVSTEVSPLRTYFSIGTISNFIGISLFIRFFILYLQAGGDFGSQNGYVQSLIIASVHIVFGFTCYLVALLADQIKSNRFLLQQIYTYNRSILFNEKNNYKRNISLTYSKKDPL